MAVPYSPERLAEGRARFGALADAEGLEYGPRTHWYDSKPAHEATAWATAHGDADAFKRAVFRAYFVENRNIGSADVLAGLAADVGLDGDDLRAALDDGRHRATVEQQYAEARMLGVTAVPTFVAANRAALVGAHPYESFEKLMAHVGARRRATPASPSG
jgi:predicted DsbA family dithiol-disulfide isomerase